MVRSVVQVLVSGAVVVALATTAAADPLALETGPDDAMGGLFVGGGMPDALLVGAFGGGFHSMARAPHGWFLGVETGWARWLAFDANIARADVAPPSSPNNGWAFGVRGGYQLRSGLAVQMRFDDLGVDTSPGSGSLLIASGGLRYSFPFVVMPFAEVLFGAMFSGTDATPAAGLGVGVSAPVARHAALDLSVRDWIADLGGSVRHIPTVMVGINLGFGG
jgi:hypothetical protein